MIFIVVDCVHYLFDINMKVWIYGVVVVDLRLLASSCDNLFYIWSFLYLKWPSSYCDSQRGVCLIDEVHNSLTWVVPLGQEAYASSKRHTPPGQEWPILLFACCILSIYIWYIFCIFTCFQVYFWCVCMFLVLYFSWHDWHNFRWMFIVYVMMLNMII